MTALPSSLLLLALAATAGLAPLPHADPAPADEPEWSNWRGPENRGTAPGAAGRPTRWSVEENVVWRTAQSLTQSSKVAGNGSKGRTG